MKRATANLEFYVKDNFEPGDCDNCPFKDVHETEVSHQVYERKVGCNLGSKSFRCPIKVKEPSQYEQLGF